VEKIRSKEETHLKGIAWWDAILSFITMAVPQLSICATLFLYVQVHGDITPARAFFVVNLFVYLNFGCLILPMITLMWSQIKTNLERLGGLLKIENDFKESKSDGVKVGEIQVQNANFSWDSKNDILQNVNMSIQPGSLICVVGAVGSGKTTLVNGLLSLLSRTHGSVRHFRLSLST